MSVKLNLGKAFRPSNGFLVPNRRPSNLMSKTSETYTTIDVKGGKRSGLDAKQKLISSSAALSLAMGLTGRQTRLGTCYDCVCVLCTLLFFLRSHLDGTLGT